MNGSRAGSGLEGGPIAEGLVRDYFFVSHGVYAERPGAPDQTAGTAPLRFSLHQNRPNPFSGSTQIAFDLPSPCGVKLEVFDVQGRRVRELLDTSLAAGRHAFDWDHRDDRGRVAKAGVYLYRITAGGFRDQRTMTALP